MVRAYLDLVKYKLSFAVVFSAVTGYLIAGVYPDITLFYLIIGIFLLASGSAAMNQYTERMIDAKMGRTMKRPLPLKIIPAKRALLISLALFVSGSLILLCNGILPFILGILTVILYNILYTRLKRKTPLSIIPGALVGALPPLIGFFSTGQLVLTASIIAFAGFMFLWQIPHFWLIIIKYHKEYKSAGFPTISDYFNEKQIRNLVFIWVILSTFLILLFFIFSDPSFKIFLSFVTILNISFIWLFHRLLFSDSKTGEIKGAFILINAFSIIVMSMFIIASFFKVII